MNDDHTGAPPGASDCGSSADASKKNVSPAEIQSLVAKVRASELTAEQAALIKQAVEQSGPAIRRKSNALTEIATVLGGGAAVGLTALAFAPTAVAVSAVAAIAGGFATWLAAEKIEKHDKQSENGTRKRQQSAH